jgi:hypothetical protein
MMAMQEARTRSYSSDEQLRSYAKRWKLNYEDIKTAGEDTPMNVTTLLPVAGLDVINKIALENKKIQKLLTAKQLHELVHPMGHKPI